MKISQKIGYVAMETKTIDVTLETISEVLTKLRTKKNWYFSRQNILTSTVAMTTSEKDISLVTGPKN